MASPSLKAVLTAWTAAIALSFVAGATALAHHGWSWTEDGFFELTGIVEEVYVGNPHATLTVDVEGETWHVDLAPPSRTIRAGFTEDKAAAGDEVTAIGHRSRDAVERSMKAVRIIVGGHTYDVYPNRVPSD